MRFFVGCAPGLEPLLAAEVRALGVADLEVMAGGVELEGDRALLYRLHLELGLAQQVRVRLATFPARRFPALVRGVAEIDLRPHLGPDTPVEVRATARKSRLYHTGAVAQRVREGLALSLGRPPPEPGEGGGAAPRIVHARLERDICTVSLDVSGEPLHRRGYRLQTAKAPLREDLARALIVASGWDLRSPFVDPFVGSGTLPIEAALLARGLPPGAGRRFAFMDGPDFDGALFDTLRGEALTRALPSLPAPCSGATGTPGRSRRPKRTPPAPASRATSPWPAPPSAPRRASAMRAGPRGRS